MKITEVLEQQKKATLANKMIAAAQFTMPAKRTKILDILCSRNHDTVDFAKAMFALMSYIESPFHFGSSFNNGTIAADLQAFSGRLVKNIQGATFTSDLPDLITNMPNIFRTGVNYDMGWQLAFAQATFDEARSYFEIANTQSGLRLDKLGEGEQAQLYKMTGSSVQVPAVKYGAGLQWAMEVMQDRRMSLIIQGVEDFRDKIVLKKAEVHYLLLVVAALGQAILPWQGVITDSTLKRDILSINNAGNTIADSLKDEVGADWANAPMLIYCSPNSSIRARINAALNYVTIVGASNSDVTIDNRPFQMRPTYMLKDSTGTALPATRALMVYAGRKILTGDKMLPTQFDRDDIITFAKQQTVFMRFGATVGDVRQSRAFDLV